MEKKSNLRYFIKTIDKVSNKVISIDPRVQAYFICLITLIFRSKDRLIRAGLWAEDGTRFLSDQLHMGFSAIFEPYAGYYHFIPRFATWLFQSSFSLKFYPYLKTLFCIGLAAYIFYLYFCCLPTFIKQEIIEYLYLAGR